MAPVRLRHIHLPASSPDGVFPSYKTAAAVQELLRRRLLNFKDAEASLSYPLPTPHPTLLSFTPQPTYTLGRRQAEAASPSASSPRHPSSLSPAAIARLKAPLRIRGGGDAAAAAGERVVRPAVLASPRGGLATYHGPGQVVLWPVMVIAGGAAAPPLGYRSFTVRCYARLLEDATTALLGQRFGLAGFTTGDPGVWVRTPPGAGGAGGGAGEVRKISALGIHLRRHVSSLGAAVNLDMPTTRGGGAAGEGQEEEEEETNPWARFVACGLEGRGVTCVAEELRAAGGGGGGGTLGLDAGVVAGAWAEELARGLGLGPWAVEAVGRDEVEELVDAAERAGHFDAVGRDEI